MLALAIGSLVAVSLAAAQPARPRIGLVLGGGGARGTAHVGVLEVIEQMRVPVDCIAGASMGSLVAGAYLSGVGPGQMMERLDQVDWHDLFRDGPARGETNYRERRLAQSYYPGLEAGRTREGMRTARGGVGGQKIKLFFNTLVGADRAERTIGTLPLPLAIIATGIGNGERVVFRDGEPALAMRARRARTAGSRRRRSTLAGRRRSVRCFSAMAMRAADIARYTCSSACLECA